LNYSETDKNYIIHKALAFFSMVRVAISEPLRLLSSSLPAQYSGIIRNLHECDDILFFLHEKNEKDVQGFKHCQWCEYDLSLDNWSVDLFTMYFPTSRERFEALGWFQSFLQTQDLSLETLDALSRPIDTYVSLCKRTG
jgi:hypothetical protein